MSFYICQTIQQPLKKQFVSLFFLFILLVPAVATYTWLQHHKRAIKKEVKWKMIAGIDKKELVFFEFSTYEINTKLRWQHSKEFEYNNQMYDVVEKKIVNGKTQLWCWLDSEETILNQKLQKLLTSVFSHDTKSKDKENQVFLFYKTLYFQEVFDWKPLVFEYSKPNVWHKNVFYKYLQLNTVLQPPKF